MVGAESEERLEGGHRGAAAVVTADEPGHPANLRTDQTESSGYAQSGLLAIRRCASPAIRLVGDEQFLKRREPGRCVRVDVGAYERADELAFVGTKLEGCAGEVVELGRGQANVERSQLGEVAVGRSAVLPDTVNELERLPVDPGSGSPLDNASYDARLKGHACLPSPRLLVTLSGPMALGRAAPPRGESASG